MLIIIIIISIALILHNYVQTQEIYVKKDVSDVYNIYTTQAFFVQITSDTFYKAIAPGDSIEYIASIAGMPDLPVWMHSRHPNSTGRAYLYGSPALNDDGDIDIEVIALNQYNYDITKDFMKFRVIKREKTAKFEVELKFVNYNLDNMFENNRFDDVLQIFKDKLWKDSQDVYITKIAAPLDVGQRLPLDPREKEGVIMRIGSIDNYTRDILDLEREVERIKNRNPCPRKYKATSAEYMFRNKGFYSDWCSFQLIRNDQSIDELIQSKPIVVIMKPEIHVSVDITKRDELSVKDSYYIPFRQSVPKRDYLVDLMVCFLVPLLMATMIISSLTCIFFYNKEHLIRQQLNETPEQLQQFKCISLATQRLRALADNRDNPIQPTNPYATLPRYSSLSRKPLIHPYSTLPKAMSLSLNRTNSLHLMATPFDPIL
ncbi:alpha-sarcoglycan-like [Oppia nitens]|uniref:alpha-sarcoglycan-like n=1 Tax=Oppia nitens TaxID=1686743 RepID=UPI0023DC85C3|nr:alpha-sarcoglycan-like [Oppia nitens]